MKGLSGIIEYNKFKIATNYYIVSLFMLANGNLFSFIFKYIHFNFWRQFIFFIGVCILFSFKNIYIKIPICKIIKTYLFFAFIILLFALITYIFIGFSIIRLGFSFWIYFCGVPFILFPHIFKLYMKGTGGVKFFNIFIALGLFSTAGIILDYCLGGLITKFFFLFNSNMDDYSFENIGRYYFLTESPTSFGLFYCFCFICVCYRIYLGRKVLNKILYLIIAISFLFGGWLTGSRQILLALLVELAFFGIFYLLYVKDNKIYLIYALIAAMLSIPSIINNIISDNEQIAERFTSSNIKEDKRSSVWKQGFEETVEDFGVLFFGKALGYTVLNNVGKGEEVGYHYENTYFARISETGIIGLLIFLYPCIIIFSRMRRINFFKSLIMGFIISFILISYISPNGTHQTSQMVLFTALGMILDSNYFSILKNKRINR